MSTPATKRRRLNAATQALSKPFRSPFKGTTRLLDGSAPHLPNRGGSLISTTENRCAPLVTEDQTDKLNLGATPATTTSHSARNKGRYTTTYTRTPPFLAPGRKYASPVAAAQLNVDPDIALLLKAQRELEKALKVVREEIDAAEQARKIEKASMEWNVANQMVDDGELDAELLELREKWRSASRLAAEELFGKVRDRVNRMGGPRAWKEAQRKQHEYQNSWDDRTEAITSQDADDSDAGNEDSKSHVDKKDLYAQYDIDVEKESGEAHEPLGNLDDGAGPGEEDDFTMAMMLRTLNVELNVIGYDRAAQRWTD